MTCSKFKEFLKSAEVWRNLDPNIQANIEAKYHLDWPLWKQYLQYIGPFDLDEESPSTFGGVLTGDFGPSFRYRDFTVNDIIAESLPISALLGIVSMMWALALGVSTGIASGKGTAAMGI